MLSCPAKFVESCLDLDVPGHSSNSAASDCRLAKSGDSQSGQQPDWISRDAAAAKQQVAAVDLFELGTQLHQ